MADLRHELDALFTATRECGDAARGWFDGPGLAWRRTLPAAAAAAVAVESLGITARLLVLMSWLLDPAHGGAMPRPKPFAPPAEAPLPETHPLTGTPGGVIAARSRALVARGIALAAIPEHD